MQEALEDEFERKRQQQEEQDLQKQLAWFKVQQAQIKATLDPLQELDTQYHHVLGNVLAEITEYRGALFARIEDAGADRSDEEIFMGIIGRDFDEEFASMQRQDPSLDIGEYYPTLHGRYNDAVKSASVEHLEEYAQHLVQGQVIKDYIDAEGKRLRDKLEQVLYEHDAKASEYLIDLYCMQQQHNQDSEGKEGKEAKVVLDNVVLPTPTLSTAISSALFESEVEIPDVLSDLIAGLALNVRAKEAVQCVFLASQEWGSPRLDVLMTSTQAAAKAAADAELKAQRRADFSPYVSAASGASAGAGAGTGSGSGAGAGAGAGASRKRSATSAFGSSEFEYEKGKSGAPRSKRARTSASVADSSDDEQDDQGEETAGGSIATPTASVDWKARFQAEDEEHDRQREERRRRRWNSQTAYFAGLAQDQAQQEQDEGLGAGAGAGAGSGIVIQEQEFREAEEPQEQQAQPMEMELEEDESLTQEEFLAMLQQ